MKEITVMIPKSRYEILEKFSSLTGIDLEDLALSFFCIGQDSFWHSCDLLLPVLKNGKFNDTAFEEPKK